MKHSVISRFLKQHQALAAIEVALVVPILFILLIGGVEVTRYLLVQQKIDAAISAATDVVTQQDQACLTKIGRVGQLVREMLSPYLSAENHFRVIITSVASTTYRGGRCFFRGDRPCITWQMSPGGVPLGSKIGHPSGYFYAMPGDMVVTDDAHYITTEILYTYQPLLPISAKWLDFIIKRDIYDVAVGSPRGGSLYILSRNC